jgi:hypothetical protein
MRSADRLSSVAIALFCFLAAASLSPEGIFRLSLLGVCAVLGIVLAVRVLRSETAPRSRK